MVHQAGSKCTVTFYYKTRNHRRTEDPLSPKRANMTTYGDAATGTGAGAALVDRFLVFLAPHVQGPCWLPPLAPAAHRRHVD